MFAWLKRVVALRQVLPQPIDRWWHANVLSWPHQSDAGIFVSEEHALQNDTAWACGTLIARSIASMPSRVLVPRGQSEGDGNERLLNHPVELFFHREANPEMAAFQFVESALLNAIFQGNFFAEIERDQIGRPIALWPIQAERVYCYHSPETGELLYDVRNFGQGLVTLQPHDVFHLAGPRIYGNLGMSVISYARQSLGVALAQERYAGSFIANQAAPSGMLTVKGTITKEGLKTLKAEVDQNLRGPRRAGKIIYSDSALDWKQISVSPQDAQFLAQRQFSVETICRWFGVPPQLVGVLEKSTLNNVETTGQQFLTYAIRPWIVRLEQEANRKLLDRAVAGRRPFLKIDAASLVRANMQAQYAAFALARQWGFLSVNDIRHQIDQEPIGPEGDVYLQPLNMEPAAAGEQQQQRGGTQ